LNFDDVIDRRDTDCLKYDFAARRGRPADALPLWVADMDFSTPSCVTQALAERIQHGIFGYSDTREDYAEVLHGWFARRFGWEISPEWLVKTPGVVFAICAAIRALTEKGDAILIQPPVYYPFRESILANGRRLVENQLIYSGGKYSIDFDDFERQIKAQNAKLFILCSPHNPVGRVWTEQEFIQLGDICVKHGVTVVSDEIHADIVYPGHRHHVFAALKPEFSEIAVTCTSPAKSFNLAGLHLANNFIPNPNMRREFRRELVRAGVSQPNCMGFTACRAAYAHGEEWLGELLQYLAGNLDFIRDFLRERLPQIKLVEPEGAYLAWLDCVGLGLDDTRLDELIVHKAGLWLDAGPMFGPGGAGFQRVNYACPRAVLGEALERFERAVKGGLR
jgi:cystathionine beta-lyase